MTRKSNLIDPSLVELGARETLNELKRKGLLSLDDEMQITGDVDKVKNMTKAIIRDLLAGKPMQDDFFEQSATTTFQEKLATYTGTPSTLSNQIRQFIHALIISREDITARKFEVLHTALAKSRIEFSDTEIKQRIERAKSIIRYSIGPLINIEKKKGFIQVRNDLWMSKGGEELRTLFVTEKLYHIFIDLAEFFMKRHLPRLIITGQRFRRHIKPRRAKGAHTK